MAGEKPQRVSIGFIGSQVMTGLVAPDELARLRDALGSDGWRDIRFDDGTAAIDLSKVVYVLVEDEEQRVGFGA